jgi:predicted Fe-S protein YdhL (DUF1289 family)
MTHPPRKQTQQTQQNQRSEDFVKVASHSNTDAGEPLSNKLNNNLNSSLNRTHEAMIRRRWDLISKMDLSTPLPSPCVSVCLVDEDSICMGCQRHIEEIAGWSSFDSTEQLRIWTKLIERLDQAR